MGLQRSECANPYIATERCGFHPSEPLQLFFKKKVGI